MENCATLGVCLLTIALLMSMERDGTERRYSMNGNSSLEAVIKLSTRLRYKLSGTVLSSVVAQDQLP